jgi:hypothetical protein
MTQSENEYLRFVGNRLTHEFAFPKSTNAVSLLSRSPLNTLRLNGAGTVIQAPIISHALNIAVA